MSVGFDSVSAGSAGLWSNSAVTQTITVATAGAVVFLDVFADRTVTFSSVTCGGNAMTLVDTASATGGASGNGFTSRYKYVTTGSGSHTVSFTPSGSCYGISCAIAFTGVDSIGTKQSTNARSSSPSHSPTNASGSYLLQSFAGCKYITAPGALTSLSGGTNKYNAASSSQVIMSVNYASSGTSTTFSGTCNNSLYWVSLAHELVPAANPAGGASTTAAVGLTAAGVVGRSSGADTTVTATASGANWPTANPFELIKQKLGSAQSVVLQTIGDSTVYGAGDGAFPGNGTNKGWPGRLAVLIGQKYDVDVLYQEYNASTHTYPSASTLYSGSGAHTHTLTIRQGGINSQYISTLTTYINSYSLLGLSTVDAVLIGTGINDAGADGLVPATYVPAYKNFLALIRTKCPGATIVATTQDVLSASAMSGSYSYYDDNYNALLTELLGTSVTMPISPAMSAATTTYPGVYVLDTEQAYGSTYQSGLMYDNVHPNSTGYATQAAWMYGELVTWTGGASTTATVTLTAAGSVTAGASGGASTTATATLTAAGTVGASAAADTTAAVGLTAAGVVGTATTSTTTTATATLTATGNIGAPAYTGTASTTTAAGLTAAGIVGCATGADLSTTAGLTAAGTVARSGGSTATLTATLTAAGITSAGEIIAQAGAMTIADTPTATMTLGNLP